MGIVELLSAVVGGDDRATDALVGLSPDDVVTAAGVHGVLPLIAERLAGTSAANTPVGVRVAEQARWQAAGDMLREMELRQLLQALEAARIDALVIKGAQLAYSCYTRPDLRPRVDTDLLIAVADRARVAEVLHGLEYAPPEQVTGELVMYQASYVLSRQDIPVHTVDVHWRIANPQLFAGLLTFEELRTVATDLPRLGPSARGLSSVHALLVACVHRVAHHFDSDCLVWLYDIHLLTQTLSDEEWADFLVVVRTRHVSTICARGIERARGLFQTPVPPRVLAALTDDADEREETAAYLSHDRRQVDNFLTDVRALPGWPDRMRLVQEHLFPSATYMRGVYAPTSRAPLAFLYVRRVWRGARRWLTRS